MSAANPMRLALSHFLRTLRERDEFDRLLPELLTQMGYVPLVKPKAGVRQFGVDFHAAGRSAADEVEELLLFVIKQGDIGRRTWDGDPNAVRQSMDEIIDVWLASHVPPEYQNHRKVIIVATTGDMGQEVLPNWAGFASRHPHLHFRFWGADHVSELVEEHLLNEHLFDGGDRADLRKALVMGSDPDYRYEDLCALMLRQLGLHPDGSLSDAGSSQSTAALVKALRRVHLAALVCSHWVTADGNRRQALWVLERTTLWCFHRALQQDLLKERDVRAALQDVWLSYLQAAGRFCDAIAGHVVVKDGLSGYTREGAEYSVLLLQQVGLLATIGLAHLLHDDSDMGESTTAQGLHVAEMTIALLRNHPAAASPRLDEQVIDVCLALILLIQAGRYDVARWWLAEVAGRLDLAFKLNRLFPVGSDSFDDLVDLDVGDDAELKDLLKQHSWMLATVASWCVMLDLDEVYVGLAHGLANAYTQVGSQLWHPPRDWPTKWYFGPAHHGSGIAEAPYPLPATAGELRERIAAFNASGRLIWEENSPGLQAGLWALDFIACRHFRTPVPASMWYHLKDARAPGDAAADAAPPHGRGGEATTGASQ